MQGNWMKMKIVGENGKWMAGKGQIYGMILERIVYLFAPQIVGLGENLSISTGRLDLYFDGFSFLALSGEEERQMSG
jgi:hypothetical protein